MNMEFTRGLRGQGDAAAARAPPHFDDAGRIARHVAVALFLLEEVLQVEALAVVGSSFQGHERIWHREAGIARKHIPFAEEPSAVVPGLCCCTS